MLQSMILLVGAERSRICQNISHYGEGADRDMKRGVACPSLSRKLMQIHNEVLEDTIKHTRN